MPNHCKIKLLETSAAILSTEAAPQNLELFFWLNDSYLSKLWKNNFGFDEKKFEHY